MISRSLRDWLHSGASLTRCSSAYLGGREGAAMGNVSSLNLWLNTAAEQLARCSLQQRAALGCSHTHLHTENQDCSWNSCRVGQAIFNYSNFSSSVPTLLISMKFCVTPGIPESISSHWKPIPTQEQMLPNPWSSHNHPSQFTVPVTRNCSLPLS